MVMSINSYRYEQGWRPTDLGANLRAWWDADNISSMTKDGSNFVSQWNDLSGNNFHLTQATGTAQPQLTFDVLNGRPGLNFAGGDYMLNAAITQGQPVTYVVVIKNPTTTVSVNEYVYDSRVSNKRNALIKENTASADDYSLFAGTIRDTGYGYATTGEILIANYNAPTSAAFRYNGAESSYGSAGNNTLDGFTLGGRYDNTETLIAHICEVFIVSGTFSEVGKTTVDSYLKPKWGISY